MPFLQRCAVLANDRVAPDHYRIRLFSPEIATTARPAQFCMLQVQDGYYPLLRRPMSFEQIDEESVTVLYKVEGEGTRMLAGVRPESEISVQGPLGNGFPIDDSYERHIMVAGGIGFAPFPGLADVLEAEVQGSLEVIVAARTSDYILCVDHFEARGCTVHLATDDGSVGDKAYAAAMLEKLKPTPRDRVYVCGPMIMMSTTSDVAVAARADCQVALEAQMACGDGACLGCVVESTREFEGEKMVRVCCDGPIFDTNVIDWEAHNMAYDR